MEKKQHIVNVGEIWNCNIIGQYFITRIITGNRFPCRSDTFRYGAFYVETTLSLNSIEGDEAYSYDAWTNDALAISKIETKIYVVNIGQVWQYYQDNARYFYLITRIDNESKGYKYFGKSIIPDRAEIGEQEIKLSLNSPLPSTNDKWTRYVKTPNTCKVCHG